MADAAVSVASTGAEPPSYDGFGFEAFVRSSNGNSDLPAYTRRPTPPPTQNRTPREFTFDLKNRSGVVWGGITVEGDPRLTKTVPTILEGTEIVGSAHLKLKTTEAMQAVCVIVKGEVLGSAQQGMASVVPLAFLEMRHVLWTASEGDPSASETTVPTTNRIGSKLNGIKLKGDYSWPFAISLPEEVAKEGKTYRLPHSFTDRTAVCSVRYTIELRVVRGKLRPDDKVAFPFAFFLDAAAHPSFFTAHAVLPRE
ncbi:hypothetical protein MKEN_00724900 [Mycena kentingensis (nom. inval.)]|nr:hypothetical protein MKEN_00724900 [Mycena kentingensis (nom. inval.)]